MMKNKKLKIFVYLTVLLGFLVSCRTDFVNEQIVKSNNTSSLASRRISLKESSHRQKLTPILSELKKNLNSENTSGKNVNFGDSIMIDTDNIIMIENSLNYHTYTFAVKRTNAKPNDPIENLLLSPLPNGTYREFWITYYLTEIEKKQYQNSEFIIPKNKIKTVEIIPGTFVNGQLAQVMLQDCEDYTFFAGYTKCGSGEHKNGQLAGDPNLGFCNSTKLSVPIFTTITVCESFNIADNGGTGTDWMFGGGNNGNTGGGIFSCPDCPAPEPCVQVPTSPTPSTTITDENGCVVGLPTTPNIGIDNTPCNQLKKLKEKPNFQNKMSELKNNVKTGIKEKGFMFHTDSDQTKEFSPVLEGGSPYNDVDINFEPYLQSISTDLLYRTYGSAHDHLENNPEHIGVPTPEDLNQLLLYGMLETKIDNPYRSDTPTKAIVMVPTKIGLFALKINDIDKLKAFIKKYMKDMTKKQTEDYMKKTFQNPKEYNIRPTSTHDEQVTGFLRFMQDEDLGIDFFEGDKATLGNWRKLELVNNGNGNYSYNQTPCNL